MKKINSNLFKKLKSYSALAVPLIAGASTANGQIVYTDVIPNDTIRKNGFGFGLDLNGDDTLDYAIGVIDTVQFRGNPPKFFSFHVIIGEPYHNNSIAATTFKIGAYTLVYPLVFNAGDFINAGAPWNNHGSQTMGSFQGLTSSPGTTYGNWKNVIDKYLGLRFKKEDKEYYGWARLDAKTNKDTVYFIMKDFAYQSIADSGIVAGDTGAVNTAIHEVVNNHTIIFSYEKQVYISSSVSAKGAMIIRVINMAGQEVKFYTTDQNQYHFSLTDFPDGLYIVSVEQNGTVKTKKILLR